MPENAIVKGSISEVAKRTNSSIVDVFMNCKLVALCDCSGSMDERDFEERNESMVRQERTRYERECSELAKVQAEFQGKIAIVAFNSDVAFCPDGKPFSEPTGGTDLANALRYLKNMRVDEIPDIVVLVISDGLPDEQNSAMLMAESFKCPINTIFVGDKNDPGAVQFLKRLAQNTKGKSQTFNSAKLLGEGIAGFLTAGPGRS